MSLTRTALLDKIPCMTTTEVSRRVGMPVPSMMLKELGIVPLAEMAVGVYWRESDFSAICYSLAAHFAQCGSGKRKFAEVAENRQCPELASTPGGASGRNRTDTHL